MQAKKIKPTEPKNNRQYNRILRRVEKNRNNLEKTSPIYQDLDSQYSVPEGYPSLEEFANQREADRIYGQAHPLRGYTAQIPLGPIAYERWLGPRRSRDGKDYRLPYFAERTISRGNPYNVWNTEGTGKKTKSEQDWYSNFGATTSNAGEYYPTWQANRNMKKGHQIEKSNRTLLGKVKHTPGSIVPQANILLGGGASTGGNRILDWPLEVGSVALAAKNIYNAGRKLRPSYSASSSGYSSAAKDSGRFAGIGLANLGMAKTAWDLNGQELVVPTSGFKVNPYIGAMRRTRREGKEEQEKYKRYNRLKPEAQEKRKEAEQKKVSNLVRLYQQRYGVEPTYGISPNSSTTSKYGGLDPNGSDVNRY